MKFINREYGVSQHNPQNQIAKDSTAGKARLPEQAIHGFGYDALVPNGVMIGGERGSLWGVKFSYFKGTKWLTEKDFINEAPMYRAGDTQGKYRYMCHGDLMASAVGYSKRATVLTLTSLSKMRVRVSFYPLTDLESSIEIAEEVVIGSASKRALVVGESSLTDDDIVFKGRCDVLYNEYSKEYEYVTGRIYGAKGEYTHQDGAVTYECQLSEDNPKLIVYVVVGTQEDIKYIPDKDELSRGVINAERNYTIARIAGSGSLAECASDISNNIISHKTYNPMRLQPHYIENRAVATKNYNYEPTAAVFGAMLSSFVLDTAKDQLRLYAGDRIMGAMSCWVSYCRTRDKEILKNALQKIAGVWEESTELIASDPLSVREVAYKMQGSPLKDVEGKSVYAVDYNCYKIIALEIMSKMFRIIERNFDADRLEKIVEECRKKLHTVCYNENLCMYMDRYIDGEFVSHYGGTSLLVLTAGVVPNVEVLNKLLLNVWDSKKLNTKHPIPTISALHPYFGIKRKKADGSTQEAYHEYAGSVVPHLNYLIYLGAVRYGINDLSAHIATKSVAMWKLYHEKYGCVPAVMLPTIKFEDDSCRDCLSSASMAIMGLQELIDVEYFNESLRPSLRFGTLASGTHKLVNAVIFDRNMDISISQGVTTLTVDGNDVFEIEGGAVIVRNLVEEIDGLSFLVSTKANVTVSIATPVLIAGAGTGDTYRFNLTEGKSRVVIAKKRIKITKI